jgi:hypothetical protein
LFGTSYPCISCGKIEMKWGELQRRQTQN